MAGAAWLPCGTTSPERTRYTNSPTRPTGWWPSTESSLPCRRDTLPLDLFLGVGAYQVHLASHEPFPEREEAAGHPDPGDGAGSGGGHHRQTQTAQRAGAVLPALCEAPDERAGDVMASHWAKMSTMTWIRRSAAAILSGRALQDVGPSVRGRRGLQEVRDRLIS